MKIYLSGPMSGIAEMNYPKFNRLAADLRAKGHEVISPAENDIPEYPVGYEPGTLDERMKMWRAFMKLDIKSLMECDTIAVMEGWQFSEGAKIEVFNASCLGMDVIDAETLEPLGIQHELYINQIDSEADVGAK
jgi:nucleoside 2-deoxyribosyltransferase